MDVSQAAKKWSLSERAVKAAVDQGKVRNKVSGDSVYIPDDEIAPLKKSAIYALLWVVLEAKNDPSWNPDLSTVPNVTVDTLCVAFEQLSFREYLDHLHYDGSLRELFCMSRITRKGMDLVKKKPLPGSALSEKIIDAGLSVGWEHILGALPGLLGLLRLPAT